MKKMFVVSLIISAALVAACGGKKKGPTGPGPGSDMGSAAGSDMGSGAGSDMGSGAGSDAPAPGSGG